jgi:hypothetical protein
MCNIIPLIGAIAAGCPAIVKVRLLVSAGEAMI